MRAVHLSMNAGAVLAQDDPGELGVTVDCERQPHRSVELGSAKPAAEPEAGRRLERERAAGDDGE